MRESVGIPSSSQDPTSPTGWFPAKFVEVLDERSKEVRGSTRRGWPCSWDCCLSDPILHHQYSIAGDDAVTEGVTDLVRGTLCPALKALFEHGLKKPSLLGGACHPWLFIEEVSQWLGPCPPLSFSPKPLGSAELVAGAHELVMCAELDPPAPLALTFLVPQAASREVERDFDSVYSRLVLCKTYR